MDFFEDRPNCVPVPLLEGIELFIVEIETLKEFLNLREFFMIFLQLIHTLMQIVLILLHNLTTEVEGSMFD